MGRKDATGNRNFIQVRKVCPSNLTIKELTVKRSRNKHENEVGYKEMIGRLCNTAEYLI
jgi:hypothetical protein